MWNFQKWIRKWVEFPRVIKKKAYTTFRNIHCSSTSIVILEVQLSGISKGKWVNLEIPGKTGVLSSPDFTAIFIIPHRFIQRSHFSSFNKTWHHTHSPRGLIWVLTTTQMEWLHSLRVFNCFFTVERSTYLGKFLIYFPLLV